MPRAIRSWASASGFRRLALTVAAREVDDNDLVRVRKLFQALELECEGALSREALGYVAAGSGALCAMASELVLSFGHMDIDGSGILDWTELVAMSLGTGRGVNLEMSADGMPPLRDDVCWRSFDLLSSAGVVTGNSLRRLLAPSEICDWSMSPGCTGGSDSHTPRHVKLDSLVREVDSSGMVTSASFLVMMQGGDREPRPGHVAAI